MLLNSATIVLLLALLNACSYLLPAKDIKDPKTVLNQPKIIKAKTPPVFIRISQVRDKILDQEITINKQNITLIDAINIVMPSVSVVAKDSGVKLNKKIAIRANKLIFENYLAQLSDISGYDIRVDKNTVSIASTLAKSWDLSTLSLSQSDNTLAMTTQPNNKGASQKINSNNDTWRSILIDIKRILGNSGILTSNEQLGQIYAIAPVAKIKFVDNWITKLIKNSKKQIHFDIAIIETNINNDSGAGLDLSITSNNNNGVGVISVGSLLSSPKIFSDINLELLVDLLNKKGYVKVRNQPNIRISNGSKATISTGDDIAYVSSLQSTVDQNGNVITTPVIKTINVGLSIELAAKVSDDNKLITLNITPVVSSIISFIELSTGSGQTAQQLRLPNIALTKLSTQVVIRPNESVLVAGLYADVVSKASKSSNNDILSKLFSGEQKSVTQKEVSLFITPHLLEL